MKYPRTMHLSFSPEIHSDDKVCGMDDVQYLIDNDIDIVISEKLDGGNCSLNYRGVFARSHSQETSCPTFNYIKNVHYYPNIELFNNSKLTISGENMYGIHSIVYSNLKDYFYVFNILNEVTNTYFSVADMENLVEKINMLKVPILYRGKIESLEWLEHFLASEIKKPSDLGGEKEGFVVRVNSSFHRDDFYKSVFKYVRKGHVATPDIHWSRNWVKATLNK